MNVFTINTSYQYTMNLQLQIVLVLVFVGFLIYLVHQVKNNIVDLKYILAWFLLDIGLMIVTCFPKTLIWFSNLLGIESPINAVFFLGFIFSLLIIYLLTISLSRMSYRITKLTQHIALFEKNINETKSTE